MNKTKKLISILLTFLLLISFVACSNNSSSGNNKQTTNVSENGRTKSENKVEKSVDAVAEYLGFIDGEEQYYTMIGAKDGKAYNNGELEIYLFDESSDSYKAAIDGSGFAKADAYKDGIVLIFPNKKDQTIIDKFNDIKF